MKDITQSKTEENLISAFSIEAENAVRYAFFSHRASIEGLNETAMLFASSAAAKQAHATGQLQYLRKDPISGNATNRTRLNIQSAIQSEAYKSLEMYPRMAEVAREEGFHEIADWFESLIRAKQLNERSFNSTLYTLLD